MAGAPTARRSPGPLVVRGLSDTAQFELLVGFRRHPDLYARRADGHRYRAGDALRSARRFRLRFCRAHHAGRELRLALALHARQWCIVLLRCRLHPYGTRHVLRLLQRTARGTVDSRCHLVSAYDRHRIRGLCAAVGSDEFLGGDRHHQSILRHTGDRQLNRDLAVGWVRCRGTDAQPVLLAALSPTVRDRRRCRVAHLGAACGRSKQSNRSRAQDRQGCGCIHALCHDQRWVPHRRVLHRVRLVRLLHPELSALARQLRSGKSRADTDTYRAGMVLPAVLRHPARHPQQAPRRNRTRRLDHCAGVHALARYVAGAFGQLPAAVSAVFVHLLCCGDRAWLSRFAGTDGRLCHRSTHSHDLLFRVLLRHPAAAGTVRKNQAATEFDLRISVAARRFSRRIGPADPSRTGLRKRSTIRAWRLEPN